MTRFVAALFIERREAIPHDGTRHGVTGGWLRRQDDAEARAADDALLAELAAAMKGGS